MVFYSEAGTRDEVIMQGSPVVPPGAPARLEVNSLSCPTLPVSFKSKSPQASLWECSSQKTQPGLPSVMKALGYREKGRAC